MAWLGANFDATFDANRQLNRGHFESYSLFTISRVGVASGNRYFGAVDWYQRGADYLLTTQLPDGTWPAGVPGATALDLLFLAYGSSPVRTACRAGRDIRIGPMVRRESALPTGWATRM